MYHVKSEQFSDSTFGTLCNHHLYLVPKHYNHLKRKLCPLSLIPHFLSSQPLTTANPCLLLRVYLCGHFIQMELYDMSPSVSGFFHLA